MLRTAYGIHDNNEVMFFTVEATESYLFANYPECFTGKDSFIELCENMIWENRIIRCEGCDEVSLRDDMDDCWVKPRCCDIWFCHEDCHG